MSPSKRPFSPKRRTWRIPGVEILEVCSEILTLYRQSVPSLRMALSLYTPPRAGWSNAVASFVPTPHTAIVAPWSLRLVMMCSSSSLLATITASGNPSASRIRRASMERYARSPESRRIPIISLPIRRSWRPASQACRTPSTES